MNPVGSTLQNPPSVATATDAPEADSPPASQPLKPVIHVDRRGPWIQLFSAKGFEWTTAQLPIPNLSAGLDGLYVLHLSDFHTRSRWDKAYDELIDRVEKNPPDLILFTGDFVDNKYDHRSALPILQRLVNRLRSRLGFVAILGNHDGDLLGPPLASLNVTLINNRQLQLSSGSETIELIGMAGVERNDIDLAFVQSLGPKSPDSVRIVLSHYPEAIHKAASLHPDLYLCGHTHGGQICFPNRYPPIRHDTLPRRLCTGIHRFADTWLVVNRGLGFSSSAQIRLFCPAEVTEIRLKKA